MTDTCLAIDIGGTKILVALVQGSTVLARQVMSTEPSADPQSWIEHAYSLSRPWAGQYQRVAAAVTGIVTAGKWTTLNPRTLAIKNDFPLQQALHQRLQCPALALNDAQAAAWAEYRFGAGQHRDLVFITVSTGVGGGMVLNGSLRQGQTGIAGHFGQWRDMAGTRFEDSVSGRWFAQAAAAATGREHDARSVFTAAAAGAAWAESLIDTSARRVAMLCGNIQHAFDPDLILLGGGIGLAPGFLDRVRAHADAPRFAPSLARAQLGDEAGVLGAADWSSVDQ
ncbi:ROK family protein [Natronospirillum operosum]|uniref:ROK family protein n=1 Tax=Natronospirillum operosum TaxID=2759953 RepID=A0A4Z0WGL7_9GAMM|nr:ROK family protein [Natronospirillum operosum]TGG93570.1 ROK family protein [Natronospirillum operosum]